MKDLTRGRTDDFVAGVTYSVQFPIQLCFSATFTQLVSQAHFQS